MLRRMFITAAIALIAWCAVPPDTAAQPALKDHQIMVREHTGLRGIASLFKRSFHEVRILDAGAPEQLRVGEEGLFWVLANVEAATLPVTSAWEFGDDSEATGMSVRHAFDEPGNYQVRVRVRNRRSEATRSFEVTVVTPESDEGR